MKAFHDLDAEQQARAVAESLRRVLRAITEGGLRFNDVANGNDLQARIDAAREQTQAEPAAWRLLITARCAVELLPLAEIAARDAIYVESETVIALDEL